MIGMIAAVSPEGVIGQGNAIPWRHPGDMRRFKRVTLDSTIIMGRLTWESVDRKALPRRRNLVVTAHPPEGRWEGIEFFPDLPSALAASTGPVWLVGGARIYAEGMRYADFIDLTYVPDHVTGPGVVRFPAIDPDRWEAGELLPHEDEPGLNRRVFTRKTVTKSLAV
jgi:dihydrofolate reductase